MISSFDRPSSDHAPPDRLQLLEIRFDDTVVKSSPTQHTKLMNICWTAACFLFVQLIPLPSRRARILLFTSPQASRRVTLRLQSDEIVIKIFTTSNKLPSSV